MRSSFLDFRSTSTKKSYQRGPPRTLEPTKRFNPHLYQTGSKAQAARTFGVGATSVKRYVKLQEEGKPLTPGKAPGKKGKLDENAKKLLEEDLYTRPTVTYERRAALLRELPGVRVSKATICRMVKRLGYTRKKDRWVPRKETNGSE